LLSGRSLGSKAGRLGLVIAPYAMKRSGAERAVF